MKEGVIFVCLGNICRSPMAEAIFSSLDKENKFFVDSAGTASYHIGSPPDSRTIKELKEKGINYFHQAQQFSPYHFEKFNYILAMDQANYNDILSLASNDKEKQKIRLIREFDPLNDNKLNVPDPYYGDSDDFKTVFDILWRSCKELKIFLEK